MFILYEEQLSYIFLRCSYNNSNNNLIYNNLKKIFIFLLLLSKFLPLG